MRKRHRETRLATAVVESYAVSGDFAQARFAYAEAYAKYKRALSRQLGPVHELRLYDRLAECAFFCSRPELEKKWLERALKLCIENEILRDEIPEIIMNLSGWFRTQLRTEEALERFESARKLISDFTKKRTAEYFIHYLNVVTASYLAALGRYTEAQRVFSLEKEPEGENVEAHIQYRKTRGIMRASRGRAEEAFADFEQCAQDSKIFSDGLYTVKIWSEYADWAMALGRIDLARVCLERALFVARERRITWSIPDVLLRLARILFIGGAYDRTQALFAEACAHKVCMARVSMLEVIAKLELLVCGKGNDRFEDAIVSQATDRALQSGEMQLIGAVLASHVKLSAAIGDIGKAGNLITRGLASIRQADFAWDLLALAGRYGVGTDAEHARHLLTERAQLSHGEVSGAYLHLWEANSAQRTGNADRMRLHAERAAQDFARLGWTHAQREALEIIGEQIKPSGETNRDPMLGNLKPALTNREQQVADLVLKGLSNREIGLKLSIREHTVESHMTSILNRLGLRSRWQLPNLLK